MQRVPQTSLMSLPLHALLVYARNVNLPLHTHTRAYPNAQSLPERWPDFKADMNALALVIATCPRSPKGCSVRHILPTNTQCFEPQQQNSQIAHVRQL